MVGTEVRDISEAEAARGPEPKKRWRGVRGASPLRQSFKPPNPYVRCARAKGQGTRSPPDNVPRHKNAIGYGMKY
jgi:hypothetical protein